MSKIVMFSFALIAGGVGSVGRSAEARTVESVLASDIAQRRTEVIGILGIPLGKVMEIEATIIKGPLDKFNREGAYQLRVEKLDGRQLGLPVVMSFTVNGGINVRIAPDPESLKELFVSLGSPHSRMRYDAERKALTDADPVRPEEIELMRKSYVGSRHKLVVFETGEYWGIPRDLPADLGYLNNPTSFHFFTHLVVLEER